jgi:hypothetical protein
MMLGSQKYFFQNCFTPNLGEKRGAKSQQYATNSELRAVYCVPKGNSMQ